jgi:hypothetical protein
MISQGTLSRLRELERRLSQCRLVLHSARVQQRQGDLEFIKMQTRNAELEKHNAILLRYFHQQTKTIGDLIEPSSLDKISYQDGRANSS